jgi:hypothetical protein
VAKAKVAIAAMTPKRTARDGEGRCLRPMRDSGPVVQSTNVLTAEAGRRCQARGQMIQAAAPRSNYLADAFVW